MVHIWITSSRRLVCKETHVNKGGGDLATSLFTLKKVVFTFRAACTNMTSRMILVLGSPCSGKSTIGEMIAKEHNLPFVGIGDMLRLCEELGSPLGEKAKGFMDKGELVPTDLVLDMIIETLKGETSGVIDGFPRTKEQAESYKAKCTPATTVLVLEADEAAAKKRVEGRRLDPFTGRVHHVDRLDELDDAEKARLVQRPEDTSEEAFKNTWTEWRENKDATIASFPAEIVKRVDANGSIADVFGHVKTVL